MTETEYLNCLQELQRESLSSTDAVSKRLDDIDSKVNLLMKQTTDKFQHLSSILEADKGSRRKHRRKESTKRKEKVEEENA
jgi:hypothetical protein